MSSVNLKDSPAIKDYCLLEIIGTGSYSIVYRARQKQVVVNSQANFFSVSKILFRALNLSFNLNPFT